eukprot:5955334-Pyramimonas_sp.AAC.1
MPLSEVCPGVGHLLLWEGKRHLQGGFGDPCPEEAGATILIASAAGRPPTRTPASQRSAASERCPRS